MSANVESIDAAKLKPVKSYNKKDGSSAKTVG